MALTDPQKIKVTESEATCPRVSSGAYTSTYQSSDGTVKLTLSTQNGGRKRHVCRVDLSKITTDPFDESQKEEVSMSSYIVIDRPLSGFTVAEAKKVVEGLTAYLTATITEKLLGGES